MRLESSSGAGAPGSDDVFTSALLARIYPHRVRRWGDWAVNFSVVACVCLCFMLSISKLRFFFNLEHFLKRRGGRF